MRLSEIISGAASDAGGGGPGELALTLPFDLRRKSRQRVRLDGGQEAILLLPRGTVLRHGDQLRGDDGQVVRVSAALETVSVVATEDRTQLARAAYHLGNRHLPVEITAAGLQYQHDPVLDGMVRALGLDVVVLEARFQPEAGAYAGGHGHGHGGHDHDHQGGHDHDHQGGHDHDHLLLRP